MISQPFVINIMPIFYDIGKIMVYCCVAYGSYYLIRGQYAEGVNRIKWAGIGYICLRMTESFVKWVDTVASGIKF